MRAARILRVLLLALLFSIFPVALTWPFAARLDEPVAAWGDGPMFLWDIWWLKRALLELHTNPFHTDAIFHPVGVDLYLHTLAPLRGLLALPLLPWLGL